MIRLLVADDHALIRKGLVQLIELEKDIRVISQASNGEEAYRLAKELSPDIILMDINMPVMNGITAAKKLKAEKHPSKILFLTIYNDKEYLVEALKLGVEGYILKDAEYDDLIKAVRTIYNGGVYIHPSLMQEIEDSNEELLRKELTPREIEILKLLSQGYSNKEIAQKLFLSEKTVKNHVYNIFRKLGVKDRTQAAIYMLKNQTILQS
ncbi:MAG: Response regulators consisting of a CheY-like receiver domain and a HTH DNA-binding domain [Caldanaerobacter subterraneus]|uniref:Stage 0 sporulation protein A homolog n=3 Tax=Caldanaerobacter subterraneus TaxID=911092 RepID=Q8R9D4_CALS4|nr:MULTISPECIES: response regulator transcription factor [Caldanaerobacter]AAM24882.1 Response regulators consisting of a CheY-like receiver domain and a HTH DNA-binding domain [Caldanaerobacter subterraneus subsp. tengcongensis MB4]ERM92212.1 chemotaxis protein CheY [Caldanaerobacter subterraneus subsp. yonseiensis KB-1]KUK09337.1 MAG: Response regulators consisting of a CheY-like receiver domain and a HTH DNA-binding domain [Caldanaerobacter subterraneus]MCS3915547.1 DNA-binding NarL/FixJ fam